MDNRVDRIRRARPMTCCGTLPILYRHSHGGFVKWACPACDNTETVTQADCQQLLIPCPKCSRPMHAEMMASKNYGMRCNSCSVSYELPDLADLSRECE